MHACVYCVCIHVYACVRVCVCVLSCATAFHLLLIKPSPLLLASLQFSFQNPLSSHFRRAPCGADTYPKSQGCTWDSGLATASLLHLRCRELDPPLPKPRTVSVSCSKGSLELLFGATVPHLARACPKVSRLQDKQTQRWRQASS